MLAALDAGGAPCACLKRLTRNALLQLCLWPRIAT